MRRNLLDVAGRVYLKFMGILYLGYFVLELFDIDMDYELGLDWSNDLCLLSGGMIGFIVAIMVMFIVNAIDDRKERKLQIKEINEEKAE